MLAVGGPILGWLADIFGGRVPILLGGVVALVAAVVGSWANRRYVESAA
jgi:MFS family permease